MAIPCASSSASTLGTSATVAAGSLQPTEMRGVAVCDEQRVFFKEAQPYRADRAIALLRDDELGQFRVLRALRVVIRIAIQKRDHIRFLLDSARISQI